MRAILFNVQKKDTAMHESEWTSKQIVTTKTNFSLVRKGLSTVEIDIN